MAVRLISGRRYTAKGHVAEANGLPLAKRMLRFKPHSASPHYALRKDEIDAAWVETRLMEVAERCMQHRAVLDQRANPTGEYRFDSAGANRALELLGKRFKMFVEKVALTDPTGEQPLSSPLASFPLEDRRLLLEALRARKGR